MSYIIPQEYSERRICSYSLCARPKTHFEDAIYFLMSKLNKDLRMEIFLIEPYCFLIFFIRYPFFGLFSKYVKLHINNLEWHHVSWFLSDIIEYEERRMPSFGLELFNDLWDICPKSLHADIKGNELNSRWYAENELFVLLERISKVEKSCTGK